MTKEEIKKIMDGTRNWDKLKKKFPHLRDKEFIDFAKKELENKNDTKS